MIDLVFIACLFGASDEYCREEVFPYPFSSATECQSVAPMALAFWSQDNPLMLIKGWTCQESNTDPA